MNNPRDYWTAYVDRSGGPTALAARLGIPYPTIAAVCNGSRGIGRRLAIRIATADPHVDAGKLALVGRTDSAEAA